MPFIGEHYLTCAFSKARKITLRRQASKVQSAGVAITAPKFSDLKHRLSTTEMWDREERRYNPKKSKAHRGDPKYKRGGVREVREL